MCRLGGVIVLVSGVASKGSRCEAWLHSKPPLSNVGPVSRKSRNFSGLLRVPQFPLYLRNAEVLKLRNPLGFSCIRNLLKDQLFKTSGLQCDNWLFGPEKFSGLLRNGLLALTVQRVDSTIHFTNHYPLDNSVGFNSTHPK